MPGRKRQYLIAKEPFDRRARGHEVRGAGRIKHVFVRGLYALFVIALKKLRGSLALQYEGQLPSKVVDILNAAIAATRPERAYHMGAVPGENHAIVHEAVQSCTAKPVYAHPVDAERCIPHNRRNPGPHLGFGGLFLGVGIRTKLQIYSIYVVWLLVQQGGLAAVKRRREPEPALRCRVIAKQRRQ